jgi:hypothetical protein
VTSLVEFLPIGRTVHGQCLENGESSHILGLHFFRGKTHALILTKNGLGNILGDFFHKHIWSPWRAVNKKAVFGVLAKGSSFFFFFFFRKVDFHFSAPLDNWLWFNCITLLTYLQAGWPDWANFRYCLLWKVFLINIEVAQICGLLFARVIKVMH